MTIDWRPWRRLLPVWLPAVGLCVAAAATFVWQSSESGGRAAGIRNEIEDLEAEIARLQNLTAKAETERATVAQLNESFDLLYAGVFQSLDERLTDILKDVGLATRSAGLLPGAYKYDAEEERKTGYVRFSIQFSVKGRYEQIRQLIAALQSSPEFLIVESITFAGDEESNSQELAIGVRVATYLSEADRATLDRLSRLTVEEIEDRYPKLLSGLLEHPGIGFVQVQSAAEGLLVLGSSGRRNLDSGEVEGDDPLAVFGPGAIDMVAKAAKYSNAADVMVNSLYDPERDEVAAFEHQGALARRPRRAPYAPVRAAPGRPRSAGRHHRGAGRTPRRAQGLVGRSGPTGWAGVMMWPRDSRWSEWSGRLDLNQRPPAPKAV